jgi:hypothetical protein
MKNTPAANCGGGVCALYGGPQMLSTLSYIAIGVLAFSYWLQIWKIQRHKEVRDLSLPYHILLALGFGMLIVTAVYEESFVFFMKQLLTFVPVIVIISQIIYHGYVRHDHWHDDDDPFCSMCEEELEMGWTYCPYCGTEKFRIRQ